MDGPLDRGPAGVDVMPGQTPGHRVTRVWVGVAINAEGDEMPAGLFLPELGAGQPMFTTEERIARDIFPDVAAHVGAQNNETIEIREFVLQGTQ